MASIRPIGPHGAYRASIGPIGPHGAYRASIGPIGSCGPCRYFIGPKETFVAHGAHRFQWNYRRRPDDSNINNITGALFKLL